MSDTEKLVDAMMRFFGLSPSMWADPMMFFSGAITLDPTLLERALTTRHRDAVRDGESLADYVARHYGADAVGLVQRAITGERR